VLLAITRGHAVPVLQPKGLIADQERDLMFVTLGLAAVVVIPVFIMLFTIAYKYRASNTKAIYQPDMDGNHKLEALWWGIPCVIILILALITGYATHALDPYRAIASKNKAITVQVVSLDWKWLFIYPSQKIATVNYLDIPEQTPINFQITSDAPMNSLWIPALAGQVYAMSGMSTQLHIEADGIGSYNGSSANISGSGFAGMHFVVHSMSSADFNNWVSKSQNSSNQLTSASYDTLAKPSKNNPPTTYSVMDNSLYNEIVMKYMSSDNSSGSMSTSQMQGMSM
jgi:cytochrome o ubiquinol oxidase subunit 2